MKPASRTSVPIYLSWTSVWQTTEDHLKGGLLSKKTISHQGNYSRICNYRIIVFQQVLLVKLRNSG